jgi:hypothetical protein
VYLRNNSYLWEKYSPSFPQCTLAFYKTRYHKQNVITETIHWAMEISSALLTLLCIKRYTVLTHGYIHVSTTIGKILNKANTTGSLVLTFYDHKHPHL